MRSASPEGVPQQNAPGAGQPVSSEEKPSVASARPSAKRADLSPEDRARSRIGPLLWETISGLETGARIRSLSLVENGAAEPVLPLSLSIPQIAPEPGERWRHYKERAANALGPVQEWLRRNAGMDCLPSFSSNTLQARALVGQVQEACKHESLDLVELDPLRKATLMDDAVLDVEQPQFQARHPAVDGSGVRVAVLDSGIDLLHPWLRVIDSVSTCGESVEIPGYHATHVAGCLASRDSVFPGIAPGVDLLNIKVLRAAGDGQTAFITRGIDEALDRGAHVLCLSLGFNHRPTWSDRGHGWVCKDGRCPPLLGGRHRQQVGRGDRCGSGWKRT